MCFNKKKDRIEQRLWIDVAGDWSCRSKSRCLVFLSSLAREFCIEPIEWKLCNWMTYDNIFGEGIIV
jgi:hypothetical protein